MTNDCGMQSLLLHYNKLFHNLFKEYALNINKTFQIIVLLLSCLVSKLLFCFCIVPNKMQKDKTKTKLINTTLTTQITDTNNTGNQSKVELSRL